MGNIFNDEFGWTIIDYDPKDFPFENIIKKGVMYFLEQEKGDKIDSLEDIHNYQAVLENLESVRQKMFSIFREEEFQLCYKNFAKFLIDTYADKNVLIQKTPTARIQPPNFMTTSFHTDAWYGHSQSTNSFWVPVTNVSPDNTLNIAPSREVSEVTMNKLLSGNYSLDKINNLCMEVTKPSLTKKGQVLRFGPNVIHGAKINKSNMTRVSFDFRIVNSDKDLGNKPISNYYRYNELNSSKHKIYLRDSAYIKNESFLSYSNYCSGVNPKSQLMLCSNVAKDKGLSIQSNESEIYVFEHLPVLRHYLSENSTVDGVIVFSLGIFNGNKTLAEEILSLVAKNCKKILFAAEDIMFSKDEDLEKFLNQL